MIMDPVRPWVYVAQKASGKVSAYNIYSGAIESNAPVLTGYSINSLAISSDGRTLYAHGSALGQLRRLNIASNTWSTLDYSDNGNGSIGGARRMTYFRLNGHPVLMVDSSRNVIDAATGASIGNGAPSRGSIFAVADNQRNMAGSTSSVSGYVNLQYYSAEYDAVDGRMATRLLSDLSRAFGNLRDVAISRDGLRVYTAIGGEYQFPVFS